MADKRLPEEGDRIAKLLARAGVASRREIERMIADGRVALDGKVLDTPAVKLTGLKGVTVDGKPVEQAEAARLFAFHKPSGLITAERDPRGRPTIYTALRNALPKGAGRVMPVGRLDFNTEGLLLLTNDGELKRAMELPSSRVPRTYRARAFGDITQAQLDALIEDPSQLQSDERLKEAKALVIEISKLAPPIGDLKAKLRPLTRDIMSARRPVTLNLSSDGLTNATVLKVGPEGVLGLFMETSLQLIPGRYVITGSRKGYVDVRHNIELKPDAPEITLRVACEEKIP